MYLSLAPVSFLLAILLGTGISGTLQLGKAINVGCGEHKP